MIFGFGLHICRRDGDCRLVDPEDPPDRVFVFTPLGSLIVGLNRGSWTQGWLPTVGYLDRFWPVVWHPKDRRTKIVE